MARSVETIRGSDRVYFDASRMNEFDWDDLIANLQCELVAKYPSFDKVDKMAVCPYRETLVLVENYHLRVSVSEYRGIGVVCIYDNKDSEYPELSCRWWQQNYRGVEEIIRTYVPQELKYRGTFSNGESTFKAKTGKTHTSKGEILDLG